jgi:putative two-component system response regulator
LKTVYDSLDNTEQVIFALAAAVEAKDSYTEKHTRRVAEAARSIGDRLGLSAADLDVLFRGGLVHDVGKIGVPDSILGKPGPLARDEMATMKRHTVIGEEIVRPLRSSAKLAPIIRHHHERFDGRGYPDRRSAREIPLPARIVAICDAYDALVTARPYRDGLPHHDAVAVLKAGAGSQWDAELVALAIEVVSQSPLRAAS